MVPVSALLRLRLLRQSADACDEYLEKDNFNIDTYSLELLNFINDLVKLDYEDRPTIKEVLEHRYWKTDLKSVKSV